MLTAFKWSYFNRFESILKTIQEKIFVRAVNEEQVHSPSTHKEPSFKQRGDPLKPFSLL